MLPLFILNGTVIKGKNRGKAMGFPTANMKADKSTPPGTYFSVTKLSGVKYNSITFIGTVDTFSEKDFLAETYILDFDKDIYGEKISVNILEKIRDNEKFESIENLVNQMKEDDQKAREFFKKIKQ